MQFDFNIEGFDTALERMRQMADQDVVDGAVLGGLRNGGRLVQQTAKAMCPVDTGQLRNSITVDDIPDQVGVDVGTNVEHAIYVELGTGQKGDPSVPHREDWTGMSPQPYLYPALEAHKEDIVNEVKEAVRQVMK